MPPISIPALCVAAVAPAITAAPRGRRRSFSLALLACVLWGWMPTLTAATPLDNARRAQVLLGSDRWSQVIRIENDARRSPYPSEVFALVFELGGVLWFYTDQDGTQSLSLHYGNLETERADLAPLLREIDPGFVRHEVMPPRAAASVPDGTPPFACLLESYAQLRQLVDAGESVRRARLLNLYFYENGERTGHTVLAYETADGAFVLDPLSPKRRIRLGDRLAADAGEVGRDLRARFRIADARWVPTSMPAARLVAVADVSSGEHHAQTSSARQLRTIR